jgi:phage-related baseplate assembly protein
MTERTVEQIAADLADLSISDSAPVALCGLTNAYNFHLGTVTETVIDSPATCPACRSAILEDEVS